MSFRPALLLLAAVASCAPRPVPRPPAPVAAAAPEPPPGTCRVGADGGIPVADRGIGGTGAFADRGIGGTGQRPGPNTGPNTGIVGVITGFASICLAGQEVQYAPGQSVSVDGRPAPLDVLRAGQVATVEAQSGGGGGAFPVAISLAVRHEVSGPVERVDPDGAIRVAGQRVTLPPNTPLPASGSWTMVSGFHLQDGTIAATRLDPRGAGEVLIRGIMRNDRGRLWIGMTEIRPGRSQFRQPGIPVLAVGRLNGSVLDADTVDVDGLLVDPEAFFGPRVQVVFFEGYAEGGFFGFGRRRLGAGIGVGRALARLERGANGFAPAFIRPFGPAGYGPRFEPAPRFDRGFDRPYGAGRDGPRSPGGLRDRRNDRREEGGFGPSPNSGLGAGPGFGNGGGMGGGGFFRPR